MPTGENEGPDERDRKGPRYLELEQVIYLGAPSRACMAGGLGVLSIGSAMLEMGGSGDPSPTPPDDD